MLQPTRSHTRSVGVTSSSFASSVFNEQKICCEAYKETVNVEHLHACVRGALPSKCAGTAQNYAMQI